MPRTAGGAWTGTVALGLAAGSDGGCGIAPGTVGGAGFDDAALAFSGAGPPRLAARRTTTAATATMAAPITRLNLRGDATGAAGAGTVIRSFSEGSTFAGPRSLRATRGVGTSASNVSSDSGVKLETEGIRACPVTSFELGGGGRPRLRPSLLHAAPRGVGTPLESAASMDSRSKTPELEVSRFTSMTVYPDAESPFASLPLETITHS